MSKTYYVQVQVQYKDQPDFDVVEEMILARSEEDACRAALWIWEDAEDVERVGDVWV